MESLTPPDLDTLQFEGHLTDLIIDFFFRGLARKSRQDPHAPRVMSLPSHLFVRWDLNGEGYPGVKTWIKESPFSCEWIFFPVHIPTGRGHWVLIAARPSKLEIRAYDSMGGTHPRRLADVKTLLQEESLRRGIPFLPAQWTTRDMLETCPRQRNLHDCGVFVCQIADLLVKGRPLDRISRLPSMDLRQSLRRKILDLPPKPLDLPPQRPPSTTALDVGPLGRAWEHDPGSPHTPTLLSNREGYALHQDGKTEALPELVALRALLKRTPTPPRTPDPLLDELNAYLDAGIEDPSLFPTSKQRKASLSKELADLRIREFPSPATTVMEVERTPESTFQTPPASDTTQNFRPVSLPLTPGTTQKTRTRGLTIRKRVRVNGRWVRMNKAQARLLILDLAGTRDPH